jgi:hypothetical protein
MGVKLIDRRTGIAHDYRRRTTSEHIAAFRTIAPPGAPGWVSDPEDLWNRVESSEKRKDAQIARDYVLPVPLGLGEDGALELAERVAQYICDELHVPVTLALHRNSDVDIHGHAKAVGFHAHLLFPTRRLLDAGETSPEDAGFGFGEKLTALSNRKTSGGIVERMNAAWASVANDLALTADLTGRYEHQSYQRLGIDRVPQPTLTRGQVALIKKGLTVPDPTRDILVPSLVYERDHEDQMVEQHAQAHADIVRELDGPAAEPDPKDQAPTATTVGATAAEADLTPVPAWEADLAAARRRGRLPHASLSDKFVGAAPVPKTDEEGQALLQLSGLVWAIQRSLRILGALAGQLAACGEQIRRWKTARLFDEEEMDRLRRQKKSLDAKARTWAETHRWKVWAARAKAQQPRMLRTLLNDAEVQQRALDDLKAAQKGNLAHLNDLNAEELRLLDQQTKVEKRLAEVMDDFVRVDAQAVSVLVAVMPEEQRHRIGRWMPTMVDMSPPQPVVKTENRELVMDRPRPRYRS